MTGGMLYLSITHLQRADTMQVSDVSDTFGQPYGLGAAVQAQGDGSERILCQTFWLLAFLRCCSRSTVSTLSASRPHRTLYALGWHTLPAVVLSAPAPVLRLFNFPGPQASPHGGRCTQENRGTLRPLSQPEF